MPLDDAPKPAPRATDAGTMAAEILEKLTYAVGKDPIVAQPYDWLGAVSLVVRDRIIDRWMTHVSGRIASPKRVYYLSLEFLIGRLLFDALSNLGLVDTCARALAELGVDLDRSARSSPTPRSAMAALAGSPPASWKAWRRSASPPMATASATTTACSARSSRTAGSRNCPRTGCRIGNPWEFERPRSHLRRSASAARSKSIAATAARSAVWHPAETVARRRLRHADRRLARPARQHAAAVVGARGRPDPARRLQPRRPCRRRWPIASRAEAISRVLYPSDETPAGQELRLRQEYFFASASLQDLVRRHICSITAISQSLPDKVAIQLNDTHPAIAVAELMRLLVDEHDFAWDEAWAITKRDVQLHQPHAAAGSARNLAGRAVRAPAAAAHADHLRINAQHLEQARDAAGMTDGAVCPRSR